MSTLKERFENYTKQPDDKVWQSINQSLNRRIVRRRVVTAASVSAVAASVTLALLLNRQTDNTTVPVRQLASVPSEKVSDVTLSDNVAMQDVSTAQSQTTVTSQQSTLNQLQITFLDPDDELLVPSATEQTAPDIDVPNTHAQTVSTSETSVRESKAIVSNESGVSAVSNISGNEDQLAVVEEQASSTVRQNPKIKASNDSLVVYVPNAFSPNDYNASNPDVRVFKVYPSSSASILSYKIFIYSRTGRMVYQSTDIDGAWDGRSRGVDQPMGVYTYILEVNDAVKGIQHKKGTVTLIR